MPRLGAKAFEQAAGFLRVRGGEHPLDASAVHPERYALVERMAADLGVRRGDAGRQRGARGRRSTLDALRQRRRRHADAARHPRRAARSRAAIRAHAFEPPAFRDDVTEADGPRSRAWCSRAWSPTSSRSARSSTSACTRTAWCTCRQLADRFVKDPNEVVKVGQRVQGDGAGGRPGARAHRADDAHRQAGRRAAPGGAPAGGARPVGAGQAPAPAASAPAAPAFVPRAGAVAPNGIRFR